MRVSEPTNPPLEQGAIVLRHTTLAPPEDLHAEILKPGDLRKRGLRTDQELR